MGSRSKIVFRQAQYSSERNRRTDLAYIAGFLDGDGSLIFQVKKRKDTKTGWRFMATIVFYQDSRHALPLKWFREILGIGYLSKRNDGMTELRINGFSQVEKILKNLFPFLKFKKVQAESLLKALKILKKKDLSSFDKKNLVKIILRIQEHNYQSPRKKTREILEKVLGLTP